MYLVKITTNHAIIVKKDGNKTEYTLNDNSYTSYNHAKPSGGQSTQIKYLSKSTDTYSKILLQ